MLTKIFKALFELLKQAVPTIIGILVVMLVMWILMVAGCIGGIVEPEPPVDQAEPVEWELPEPTEEPGE